MKHFDDKDLHGIFFQITSSEPVESKLASPKYLVEIQITAAI